MSVGLSQASEASQKKPPPAEGALLEAPPEGPPEAPPEDSAEVAAGGETYAIWLHFTQEARKKYYLDSHKPQERKPKKLQFTQENAQKETKSSSHVPGESTPDSRGT